MHFQCFMPSMGVTLCPLFVGHGKRSAWTTWNTISELTNALLTLANAPTEIPEEAMQVIQRYVLLRCDRTSTHSEVNKARKKMFGRKTLVQHIHPPMLPRNNMSEGQPSRVVMSGVRCWLHSHSIPSPTSWGWTRDEEDGSYEPTTLDHTL